MKFYTKERIFVSRFRQNLGAKKEKMFGEIFLFFILGHSSSEASAASSVATLKIK